MRKDKLAAGARSAQFAGGVGETDIDRNIMSDEDRAALEAETAAVIVEKVAAPKKAFRPLGSFILVRRATVEELSSIVITENIEKERPAEGTVLVIGKKVVDISVGDRVVFGKYAGTEFRLNGEILLIMDASDVQGIIEDEAGAPTEITSGTYELNVGGCIVGRS
jgi:chaperonin GroES